MTKREWKLKTSENKEDLHENNIVSGLLKVRGFKTKDEVSRFLNFTYEQDVHDPFLMKDMDKAVERVKKAVDEKQKIVVYGDYDADGVTSAAILLETFEQVGIKCDYYIPEREKEGYGLNENAIGELAQKGYQLMVTVDCGITNIEEVELAKKQGMDVIITDHHYVPETFPEAVAVVNPNRSDCSYPFKQLAGVGVAFKFAQAIIKRLAEDKVEQLKWLLDLVALGTLADSVRLVDENRIFAKYGLLVLSKTRRVGLRNLYQVGRIDIDENKVPDARAVQFQIAPRINAAGRMNHANTALELLIAQDEIRARDIALELESYNQKRMKVTEEIVKEVRALAEEKFKDKKLIFGYSDHWQLGVLGLVAGKISDEFNKPTALFSQRDDNFSGSLRSIEKFNIVEALHECNPKLIKRFGGHSQAAGATLIKENIENFYLEFDKIVENKLKDVDTTPILWIDTKLESEGANWDLIELLEKLRPFGEGNEEPVFLSENMVVRDVRTVGNGNKHLKLDLSFNDGSPKIYDTIGFGFAKSIDIKEGDLVDVVYNLRKDEWNGNQKMQMMLIDIKKSNS